MSGDREREEVQEELLQKDEELELEGFRDIAKDAAKGFLKGDGIDSVLSTFLKSTVEHCLERVVDPFVEFTKQEVNDPLNVPGVDFNIDSQLFCLPLTGIVKVEEGKINNLASLKRSEDCPVEIQDGTIVVKLNLQLSQINYEASNCHLELFCSNSLFTLKGIIGNISLQVELRIRYNSFRNFSAEISKFDFSIDGFDVTINGDPIPELFAGSIKKYYLKEYKDVVQDLSVENVKKCMQIAVKKLLDNLENCKE